MSSFVKILTIYLCVRRKQNEVYFMVPLPTPQQRRKILAAINMLYLPGTYRGRKVWGLFEDVRGKLRGSEETQGAGGQLRGKVASARKS